MRLADDRLAHTVYRRLALEDFPDDLRLGLNLGFYRTFAVPPIAGVLVHTGKMVSTPRARAKATGKLMFTLFEHGLDSPEGESAIRTLNTLHARLPVGPQEFLYVLAAFCVAPMRWIDAHGWRATTPEEREAAHVFYRGLASRMELGSVPDSFAALADWMDAYEERTFARTEDGLLLYGSTVGLLAYRFPAMARPLVRSASDALLDDRLREAFDRPRPGFAVRTLVRSALAVRRVRMRRAHRRG